MTLWQRLWSVALVAGFAAGCGESVELRPTTWDGQIDTVDGKLVVRNGERGLWSEGAAWKVIEQIRIGTSDDEGQQSFGDITSFAVDTGGRFWVLDRLSSDLRVFDRNGRHVRTIGRAGSGPGEFRLAAHVSISPEDRVWVMDPGNARISVFDTDGEYLEAVRVPGAVTLLPWPGGFDREGFYYAPMVTFRPEFSLKMGRFDQRFAPLDTVLLPEDPVERKEFTTVINGRVHDEPVPFQGGLVWRLSTSGTVWGLVTDQYRLFELTPDGDTIRVITKAFEPVAVGSEEKAKALEDLEEFVELGGKIDESLIPTEKPAVRSFFIDADGFLWVEHVASEGTDPMTFDIFDPTGRFMGVVAVPFRLVMYPSPIVRDGMLYGLVRDTLDVQYLVGAGVSSR